MTQNIGDNLKESSESHPHEYPHEYPHAGLLGGCLVYGALAMMIFLARIILGWISS